MARETKAQRRERETLERIEAEARLQDAREARPQRMVELIKLAKSLGVDVIKNIPSDSIQVDSVDFFLPIGMAHLKMTDEPYEFEIIYDELIHVENEQLRKEASRSLAIETWDSLRKNQQAAIRENIDLLKVQK